MPSTESQLSAINKTLESVTTAGQARAAIGSALVAIHDAYSIAERIDDDDRRRASWNELDQARIALERWYAKIVPTGGADFRQEWSKYKHLVKAAYGVVSGVEGAADWVPRTSNWEILRESVKEGMGTVTDVVKGAAELAGEVVGGAAGAAGKGAGSLLGGLFSGLGLSGTFYLVLIGAGVLIYFNRATVLGKVGGLVGKAIA
jgi:hypothetical protein